MNSCQFTANDGSPAQGEQQAQPTDSQPARPHAAANDSALDGTALSVVPESTRKLLFKKAFFDWCNLQIGGGNLSTKSSRQPDYKTSTERAEKALPGDSGSESPVPELGKNPSDVARHSVWKLPQHGSERSYTDFKGNRVTEFTNDSAGRTKQIRFCEPGHGDKVCSTEFMGRNDKLAIETKFVARIEKVFEDGAKIVEYDRGDLRNLDPDLVRTYESGDGQYKKSDYEDRDDKICSVREYKNRPDGLLSLAGKADGSYEMVYQNGAILHCNSNGTQG